MRALEITTALPCPIRCKFCPQEQLLNKFGQPKVMSWEVFSTCIEKVPPDVDIVFAGCCEPWVNKHCNDMVQCVHDRGHNVRIFTTMRFCSVADIRFILAIKPQLVHIHIPDAEGCTKVAITEEYKEKLRLIEPITEKFVAQRPITEEMRRLVPHEKLLILDCSNRAGVSSVGVVTTFKHGPIVCVCPYNTPTLECHNLLPDGTVTFCANDYGMTHVLGNLMTASYEDIYNSPERVRVLQAMQKLDKPCLCRTCEFALELKV